MDRLTETISSTRDSKEDFYIQGSRLTYTVLERDVPADPYLVDKLKHIKDGTIFSTNEFIIALFSAFDVTIVTSEDMEDRIVNEVKILLNRFHFSQHPRIEISDLTFDAAKANQTPFEIKITDTWYRSAADKIASDDLLHEMFVSFFVTNRLRKLVPNFQLCYGGIKTFAPGIDCCGTGICPSDTQLKVDYLLLENLNGVKLTQRLKTCSVSMYLEWFLQILFSLELGVTQAGFTHNNLNPDNIIITSNNSIKIRYIHHNEAWILSASSIAVIKNFELAHVKHKSDQHDSETVVHGSEHFGPVGFESMGIYHNETRPFYDIYKFLMWSLRITQKHNTPVFNSIKALAGFFGLEDRIDGVLQKEENLGYIYSVEVGDTEKTRSLRELLGFAIREFPSEISAMLNKQQSYKVIDIIDCRRYCLLDGYRSVDVGARHFFDDWEIRDIMNRLNGLKKRSVEFLRLAGVDVKKDINANDSEIRLSEEAIEATTEYQQMRLLTFENADLIYNRDLEAAQKLRNEINEMIRIVNMDIDSYQIEKDHDAAERLYKRKQSICRSREQVKGRLVKLVAMASSLSAFSTKFLGGSKITNISVDGLQSFD